jgi:cellulose synthase (UDP-forming)
MPTPESARRTALVRGSAVTAIAATLTYLCWRLTSTLDGASLILAIPLLLLEMHSLLSLALHTVNLWELDSVGQVVPAEPSSRRHRVAVLIPTYNESREVLLPTIAAAVALGPAHETWVLDDGNRPWVEELASLLGARYRARRSAEHAKAGNLNAAIETLDVDVVAVLDADHVARADFLTATLPYFDDDRVAVVQTPQDFYNLESFEHVSRRGGRRYMEQELFYRALAAGRNRWNAAFWCGTGALIRVAALRDVGGVAVETVTEDIHTTLRMHRRGWRTIYHNAVLARGLAAADSSQYLAQRLRWGTGAMQVLRLDSPLVGSGLTFMQRVSYLDTLLGWFDSWRTLGLLLLPPLTLLTGGVPVSAPGMRFAIWFTATLGLQRLALRLLARGRASLLQALMFEVVRLPANLLATSTLFCGGRRRFVVTPKGRIGEARARASVPRLLWLLSGLSVVSLPFAAASMLGLTGVVYRSGWIAYGAVGWCLINLTLLGTAIRWIRRPSFASDRRAAVRFDVTGPVLVAGRRGELRDVSLTGLSVVLPDASSIPDGEAVAVDLTLQGRAVSLRATVRARATHPDGVLLGLGLMDISATDQAALAAALFRSGHAPHLIRSPERFDGPVLPTAR